MPVENLPHWSILPNWRVPVLERLEAMTSILASPSGAEQRFAVRWSPRRYLEPMVTPVGPMRTMFDMAVGTVGLMPWYVPLWHDRQNLTETLGIGDTSLNCETQHREFVAGGFVMLWADEFTTEVLEVASVAPGVLTFTAGPAASWPAGTRLYPCVKARLVEMPEMARNGPRILENAIRFMVDEANDYADPDIASLPLPTYLDFPVLTTRPDEGQDISHGHQRLFDEIDGESGLMLRYDTAGKDFTLQRHHWLSLGRQEHAELRSLFYYLDGRRNPLWLPTFAEDFVLVENAAAVDNSITVQKCGFTMYDGPRIGRDHVWIALRDGTNIFREISGSSLTIGGDELIVFTEDLGTSFTPDDVARISFIALSRLESDTMEINHHSDTEGASRVTMVFRSAPNLRVESDSTNLPFPNAAMNDTPCGVLAGCSISLVQASESASIHTFETPGPHFLGLEVIGTETYDFAVAYTDDSTTRVRYVDGSGTVSGEVELSGTTTDYTGQAGFGGIPMLSTYDYLGSGTYSVGVADNGNVYFTSLPSMTPETPFDALSGGLTAVAVQTASSDFLRVFMSDATSVVFSGLDMGTDPPSSGEYTFVSGQEVGESWAQYIQGSLGVFAVFWQDVGAGRLRFGLASQFDGTVSAPMTLVSDSGGSNEWLVSAMRGGVLGGQYGVVWRRQTGGGPAGSVRYRRFDVGGYPILPTMDETSLYTLTPLGVSGYTNLANREPVAATMLANHNLVVVERRYETVGAQLRAYEVLVAHSIGDDNFALPVKTSNVIRLTPVGVGPTGDVRRKSMVAVINNTGGSGSTPESFDGREVVVVFESPVDNTGATELRYQRFYVDVCSSLLDPE